MQNVYAKMAFTMTQKMNNAELVIILGFILFIYIYQKSETCSGSNSKEHCLSCEADK